MARDWLRDFVAHTSYGEAPENVMFWVGVSTIAGALRRKVWIHMRRFQWTPNFYVLLIGPPGILKKSTSIDLGMQLLERVEGIEFGPDDVTREQLIEHIDGARQIIKMPDGTDFESSCMTLALGEFDTFFDPGNRPLVASLTRLYDAPRHFKKETKTNGSNFIVKPWLNMCACTTPGWMEDHFSGKFIRSGFASRINYIYCTECKRVALPDENIPDGDYQEEENRLAGELAEMANLAGQYVLTEDARKWERAWYEKYRDFLEKDCTSGEVGLYSRGQTHQMKLAMIISASRGMFPVINEEVLVEAQDILSKTDMSIPTVFGSVGQGAVSKLAGRVQEMLSKHGKIRKQDLYRRFFVQTTGSKDFEQAVESLKAAGLVKESGDVRDVVLEVV